MADNRKLEVIAAGEAFRELVGLFSDEVRTYDFAKELRWPGGNVVCPKCFSEQCYYIAARDGYGRKTRTGNVSARRIWKCRSCKKQFSITTHTPFHRSKLQVTKWLPTLWMMETFPLAPSRREAGRILGMTDRSSWLLFERLVASLDEAGEDHAFARNQRKTDWQQRVSSLWVRRQNLMDQANRGFARTCEWRRRQWENAIEAANDELRELIEEQKRDDRRNRIQSALSLDEQISPEQGSRTRGEITTRDVLTNGNHATQRHMIPWVNEPLDSTVAVMEDYEDNRDVAHWLQGRDFQERIWWGNGEESESGRRALMMSGSWVDLD